MKLRVKALLAFSFLQQLVSICIVEGQSRTWTPFTCTRANDAVLFTLMIGGCNIIRSGLPCFMDLIDRMVLQGVCFSDGVDSYVCNVNSNYTGDPPCCVSHFSDGRNSSYCGPSSTTEAVSTQDTTDPIGQDTSTTVSTVHNPNSTTPTGIPPMKDDNDPNIPRYVVPGVFALLIVVIAVIIIWLCCRRRCRHNLRPGHADKKHSGGDHTARSKVETSTHTGICMENSGPGQSSLSQEKSQDASQGGSQVPATTNTKLSSKENELRRRKLPTEETRQPRQEVTKAEEDSDWLPTRTAAPFSEDSGKGCTSKSVVQPFPDIYEPPTVDSIVQVDTSSPNVPTASQASDDGNSSYVPTPPKSSSLVRKQDLVTAHMSHLECKDGTQEKPSMSSVVQGYMQSLDQDDQEADAFVVQQKVKVGGDISSAVAHKQRSCFKSGGTDDETHGSVSGKGPLKKHKFPPAHFGNVGVAIICALILATFVCHGRGYTSTTLHPSLAYKYRWFDRGTPWIRALADRLAYPQMFDLHNLGPAAYCGIFPITLATLSSLYDQCQRKTADPTLNDQTSLAYNYQWLDRGTWIGAIAYPFIFGSPNLRLAVYCGIVLTTLALVIMATTLISLFDWAHPCSFSCKVLCFSGCYKVLQMDWHSTSCEHPSPPLIADWSSISILIVG